MVVSVTAISCQGAFPAVRYRLRIAHPWRVCRIDADITDLSHTHFALRLFESDFELIPRMTNARLYIDGSNRSISVGYNDRLSFRPSERPINWMASPMCDDNRHNLKKLVHKFKRDCRKAEDAFERQQAEVLVY